MPPKPKPIMVDIYGIDAIERDTPNSCKTGIKTTIELYHPAAPTVSRINDAANRTYA